MGESCPITAEALKVAKKSLKKQDSKTMKLKKLSKLVAEAVSDDKATKKMVKKWIQKCDMFAIDGKIVSLSSSSSKRKRDDKDSKESKKQKKSKAATVVEDDDGDNKDMTSTTTARTVSPTTTPDSSSFESIAEWRKENKIVVMSSRDDESGKKETDKLNKNSEYFPFATFDNAECQKVIASSLLRQCTEGNGFTKPSPIQAQSWPIMMSETTDSGTTRKRDIVGIAETGSGKTLAFAVPALSSMLATQKDSNSNRRRLPRMLVLAPTRELAMQSDVVLQEFGSIAGLRSMVLYGGVPKYTQAAELKKKTIDCIVATPGRIKDLINDGACDLSDVQHLVLDEADRMLDMGFEEDVKYIISQCKSKEDGRQTVMFSATWPAAIQEIAANYMVNPVRIYVGFEAIVGSNGDGEGGVVGVEDSLSANKRVKQLVEVIDDRPREGRLRDLLRKYQKGGKNPRILVFALYKKEAERLEYSLRRDHFEVCSIHGNKNQQARTAALAEFKKDGGSTQIMIATDVASRGLDIPNVEVVINYTFPLTIEDYVHRIGRTGRAGKSGISHTFFQPGDKSHAGELQQVMRQAGQEPPEELLKFGSTIKKKEHKLYGNFGPRSGEPMKKATKITFDYSDDEN